MNLKVNIPIAVVAGSCTVVLDALTKCFISPKPLLDYFFTHNIKKIVVTGVAGFAVSLIAETVNSWVETKLLPAWKENERLIVSGARLALLGVIYIGVGGLLGAGMGVILGVGTGYLGVTSFIFAATGTGVGAAAFIGSLLARILRVVGNVIFFPKAKTFGSSPLF